ncbi:MAG: phosphate ABC transporter permease subunit PstC, partial [Sulfurimonadaceae bacterium]|nr:phosphate ABC transporter permease subunit PstC [Sulfurimonadaceae bacterium]
MIDKIFLNITRISALLILFIVAWIFVVLFNHSTEAMQTFGFDFITKEEWAPNLDKFGAYSAIFGSVVSTFLAMLLAIPIAIGVAIFLSEIVHDNLKGFFGVSVELLAAIPSVVYGMWRS